MTSNQPTRASGRSRATLGLLAGAFGAYFCMYAFRKPVTAGEFAGGGAFGLDLKTAVLIGQLVGYTASKFLGIVVCSSLRREYHARALVGMILLAEAALCVFAVVPGGWRVVAMFVNGLPLGMVWGLVIRYLEGRRTSEVLMAGLSASFILSSGAVKDVGRWLMVDHAVPEAWMPAATGALFLLPFMTCVWLLDRAPRPDSDDENERLHRRSMTSPERRAFVGRFAVGLAPLLLIYVALTAYRDFRDNYGVEIFRELGYLDLPGLFTRTELPAGLGVLGALALLSVIRDNRRALAAIYGMMAVGCIALAGATFLFRAGAMGGLTWMIVIGIAGYLAYVPVGAVFFDRLTAAGGAPGTAVFGIYVADALGYGGSVGVQVYRDLAAHEATRLAFFQHLTWGVGLSGAILLGASWYFLVPALGHAPTREAWTGSEPAPVEGTP